MLALHHLMLIKTPRGHADLSVFAPFLQLKRIKSGECNAPNVLVRGDSRTGGRAGSTDITGKLGCHREFCTWTRDGALDEDARRIGGGNVGQKNCARHKAVLTFRVSDRGLERPAGLNNL